MRTAVVTGATSGTGLALLRRLLLEGWQVASISRRQIPPTEEFDLALRAGVLREYQIDLADARSRRTGAAHVSFMEPVIDALFNVAGIRTNSIQMSPQGRDLHYEVNCLAPYVLLKSLQSNLSRANRGVAVNVTSEALRFDRHYDPETLGRPERLSTVFSTYGTSKLALALWTKAAAAQPDLSRVRVLSVAPGPTNTPHLQGFGFLNFRRPLSLLMATVPSLSARLLISAADGSQPSGTYLIKRKATFLPHGRHAQRTLEIVAREAEVQHAEGGRLGAGSGSQSARFPER